MPTVATTIQRLIASTWLSHPCGESREVVFESGDDLVKWLAYLLKRRNHHHKREMEVRVGSGTPISTRPIYVCFPDTLDQLSDMLWVLWYNCALSCAY